jgi:hypothetical protein
MLVKILWVTGEISELTKPGNTVYKWEGSAYCWSRENLACL